MNKNIKNNKKEKIIPQMVNIKIGVFARQLINEIDQQTIPLYNFWENDRDFIATFNPIRVLMPIVEECSKIESNASLAFLLEKLGVPFPRISVHMFRHSLAHTIRPWTVELDGVTYKWAIKMYESNHHFDEKFGTIIVSPKRLLNDLRKYLKGYENNISEIKIQRGVLLCEV